MSWKEERDRDLIWRLFVISKGSNDSNYSGPSSGGDLSFEENDKNHITSKAAGGGFAAGGLGAGIGGGGRGTQQQQQKGNQSKQQRSQDAKQEIELCRVSHQPAIEL